MRKKLSEAQNVIYKIGFRGHLTFNIEAVVRQKSGNSQSYGPRQQAEETGAHIVSYITSDRAGQDCGITWRHGTCFPTFRVESATPESLDHGLNVTNAKVQTQDIQRSVACAYFHLVKKNKQIIISQQTILLPSTPIKI